ncbi:unnamed protein product [Pseudo-nitzschia multistriata]|uniref:PsbP C-terminal domain-containing protein n=1 Tax=Pseudo-nitzschia multistriata TaxID=183589 RepID=A0A448ZC89_9STRA|nr:unnamed protein product [Pseudo-nitzschia multistriata]
MKFFFSAAASAILFLLLLASTTPGDAFCFQQQPARSKRTTWLAARSDPEDANESGSSRRAFLAIGGSAALASMVAAPQSALAGIDVSGLRVEGGGNSNPVLREQLKAIDGSASGRANQIREIQAQASASAGPKLTNGVPVKIEEEVDPSVATWLYRTNPGLSPRLSRSGAFKNLFRCDDQVVGPSGLSSKSVGVTFEFPSDWLQLDRFLGGISYVDQRNGDRLYLLKTKLPEGERLATVPKAFFGTSIFDPRGTIVKSQGVEIDEYKVTSGQMLSECPTDSCSTHKRFKIRYSTVTGNGLRVERRALLDAYEMTASGDVYMLMTSSNAVKFEAKDSPERKTVEAIVDSFRIDV